MKSLKDSNKLLLFILLTLCMLGSFHDFWQLLSADYFL